MEGNISTRRRRTGSKSVYTCLQKMRQALRHREMHIVWHPGTDGARKANARRARTDDGHFLPRDAQLHSCLRKPLNHGHCTATVQPSGHWWRLCDSTCVKARCPAACSPKRTKHEHCVGAVGAILDLWGLPSRGHFDTDLLGESEASRGKAGKGGGRDPGRGQNASLPYLTEATVPLAQK